MQENSPPCDIRIDKDGTWFFRGAEMFRREIVNFFYEHLNRDASGRYLIELPGGSGDRCYVEVEDTPFVVKTVYEKHPENGEEEALLIALSDDSQEVLNPATLRVGQDNVLYCSVRHGAFDARFSRPGYYQLAGHIDYDHDQDIFFLLLNDQRFDILNHSKK